MNIATLSTLCRARGLSQSDIARLAGVSRQAVSLWFRNASRAGQAQVNIRSQTLAALAKALRVPVQDLLDPLLPLDGAECATLEAELLWDRLYPDLERLLVGVARQEPRAIARLVERRGLFGAAKIAGKGVWRRFPNYRRFLPPRRREALERTWQLQSSLGLI